MTPARAVWSGASLPAGAGDGLPPARVPRIVTDLLDQLRQRQIVYCRWQGGKHQQTVRTAPPDLDILVDRQEARRLTAILAASGFKRVVAAAPQRDTDGELSYLALEEESGRFVHLRVRYSLVIGGGRPSEYRLPWEPLILSTRRFLSPAGMFVADPSVELLVVLVQLALDLRPGSRIRYWLGKPWCDPGWLKQVHGLLGGDLALLSDLSSRLLGRTAAQLVADIVAGEPSFAKVRALRRGVVPMLDGYRLYRRGGAQWRRWWRRLSLVAHDLPRASGRVVARGGVAIGFLGCDGSGKSTLLREIEAWLSGSLGTVPIYFGSGDGPASVARWPMLQAYRFLRKHTASARSWPWQSSPGQSASLREHLPPNLWTSARALWAIVLAQEKRGRLRTLTRARNQGFVVLCDRYPQNQVKDFNDGPLLSHWRDHSWRLLRAVAAWESTPYRWTDQIAPDLVLKLHVRSEVALRRKPQMELADLQERAAVIRSLRFPRMTETVDIDANEPLDQVLRQVKRCIWRKL